MNKFILGEISRHRGFDFHIELGSVDGSFPMHTHNFCEIFFVISGSGVHKSGDAKYQLKQGELFAVKGSESHSFINCKNLQLYNIMFKMPSLELEDCKTIPGFWVLFLHEQSLGSISHLRLSGQDFALVKTWCETMTAEYTSGQSGFKTVCRGVLMQLTVLLSRQCQSLPHNEAQPDFRLARAVVHMQSNLAQPLSVNNLAKIVGLSPRHFSRIFGQIYLTSPINYLLKLRINNAKKLLSTGAYSVTQVADLCGFQDSNYFSRIFKEKTGVAPSSFKNNP